jgi:TetR/AcrR family tetracycline transcriptional repressor
MSAAPSSARPGLDRDAIARAALDVLDAVGLDALSTRKLAEHLGVSGPSLYWHFRNMGELKDLMADALLADALPRPDAPGDWRDWLADGARGIRRAALSRRDGARLLAGARPTNPRRELRMPANLARLQAAGFGKAEAQAAFLALARYALGAALGEQNAAGSDADGEAHFEFGLRAMIAGLEAERGACG